MTLCPACGSQVIDDVGLCRHHPASHGDEWAVGNRIMCGFVHRGEVPARLTPAEREDDFWATVED